MALKSFLKQTCVISSIERVNNKGTQEVQKTDIYINIPCFLYKEQRRIQDDSISTEDQVGNIKLILERNKTNVRKNQRVVVTDPELGDLGEYIISVAEIHRSFTGIGGVSLTLKKLEDGVN